MECFPLLILLQTDTQPFQNGLTWIGGGFITLLSVIGFGSIILAVLKRYWEKKDLTAKTHESTAGERIKGEVVIASDVIAWLREQIERQDGKIEKLEVELGSQREMNAKKDAKIEHLEEENHRLRERNTEQDKEIAALKNEVENLKGLIRDLQGGKILKVVER